MQNKTRLFGHLRPHMYPPVAQNSQPQQTNLSKIIKKLKCGKFFVYRRKVKFKKKYVFHVCSDLYLDL